MRQTPSGGQTPNCVKLLRWRFFHSFCVSALLVLGLLSLSSGAPQLINLELWLVCVAYGLLVGEWVVTGCVQHYPPTLFPC